MLYGYTLTVRPTHTIDSPLDVSATVSLGILTRFRVAFLRGCSGLVNCVLFRGTEQVAPLNAGETFALDGEVADTPLMIETTGDVGEFTIRAYGYGCQYTHKLQVYIDVNPLDGPDDHF